MRRYLVTVKTNKHPSGRSVFVSAGSFAVAIRKGVSGLERYRPGGKDEMITVFVTHMREAPRGESTN